MYCCHLFLIVSASVSPYHFVLYCAHLCMTCSLGISNFLEEISSLSHSIVFLYFFALITEEGFLISPCYSSELCIQMGIFSWPRWPWWCDHSPRAILECEVKWALGSITTNKASGGDGIPGEVFQILKDDAVKLLALNMPANLENSAVATGLEKVSFHSNPKERQCQRMLKLPHNCTHLTC